MTKNWKRDLAVLIVLIALLAGLQLFTNVLGRLRWDLPYVEPERLGITLINNCSGTILFSETAARDREITAGETAQLGRPLNFELNYIDEDEEVQRLPILVDDEIEMDAHTIAGPGDMFGENPTIIACPN